MAISDCTYSTKTPDGKHAICAVISGARFSLLPAAWDYKLPNFVAIRKWLKDFERVVAKKPAVVVITYWAIEAMVSGIPALFRDFANESDDEILNPVWEPTDGDTIRPLLIHDDEIGGILGEVRSAGFPNARATAMYTTSE